MLYPISQILASQNSKGKHENRKILDFVRKMRKIDFFSECFNFFCRFFYFLIILKFFRYFGNL
jgi:hypothetical protein